MEGGTQIPQTYLENTNMIQYIDSLSNTDNIPSNINQNKFGMTYNKTNDFFKTENDISNNKPSLSQKLFFNSKKNINYDTFQNNNIPDFNTLNKLNSEKKFSWREIMKNKNDFFNIENELQNPLLQNILNANLDEEEMQNIPENYLISLIQTLQGVVTQGIENQNNLEMENRKLNKYLFEIKNNCNYMEKNNEKINKSLNLLKKKNKEQVKRIKDYEKKQKVQEKNQLSEYLSLNGCKNKFYCKLCSNKVFRSKYYLDSHIKRRHNNYCKDDILAKENKKISSGISKNTKKLNELKKYFDILLKMSIKKVQYLKLNEKLNNIENLLIMSQVQDNFFNNFLINNNFQRHDDNNDDNENNNDDLEDNNVDDNLEENNDDYNVVNNDNDDIIYNNYYKEENHQNDFNNVGCEGGVVNEKNFENLKNKNENKQNEIIKSEELNMDRMEKIRENNFQNIKRYFEKGAINKNEYNNALNQHGRRKGKTKTTKPKKLNALNTLNDNKDELNQSADEIKSGDIIKGQNKNKNIDRKEINKNKNEEINFNNVEKNNVKNNIVKNNSIKNNNEIINDKIKSTKNLIDNKNINYDINKNEDDIQNINNEKVSENKKSISNSKKSSTGKISFSESENISHQNEDPLKSFYEKFTNRDQYFSTGEREYYLKSIISSDYKFNEKKIEKIVEDKITEKLINIDQTNNDKLLKSIKKLNYQMIDQDFIYGPVHCFYSRNISKLMKTKQLIEEINRYYNFPENKKMKSNEYNNSQENQNSSFKSFGQTENIENNNSMNESVFSIKNNL